MYLSYHSCFLGSACLSELNHSDWLMELIESTDHQLSITLIELALETVHLREEEFEVNKWNATITYLCTHLNYSVMLMHSATPPTHTPKGNKKKQ